MENKEPIDIFLSYSHKDEKFRAELEKHLASLKREGFIKPWHDRKITPGNEWASEIDSHINKAKIILLLISADFIASEYCYDKEMNQAIERHKKNQTFVIPIILRPVDWNNTPFAKFQALPKNAKPVTKWANPDDAYLDIVNGIRRAIQNLQVDIALSPIIESVDNTIFSTSLEPSTKTEEVNTSSKEIKNTSTRASDLFSEAIQLNLFGKAERALQLFREVKEIDKYYPNIDMEIRRLEREIASGYTDQDGRIKERKIITRTGVMAALIGFIGTVIVAIINYQTASMAIQLPINATQTVESHNINYPTNTPALVLTETITPTATSVLAVEPPISDGYTLYDGFNEDTGKLKFTEISSQCRNKFEDGAWKFECFGSATETVKFTLFHAVPDAVGSQGIEMAFYTLPLLDGTSEWGKYQLLMRFGADCGNPERGYVVSIKPNELTFIEADSKGNSINPPSPTKRIGTLQPHIIKIELQNGKINYYLDGEFIRDASPLENSMPVCWLFQSQDNGNFDENGYRGVVLQWVAVKP